MQLTGIIEVIGDEKRVSENFKKRDFVLLIIKEENLGFKDFIKFELVQDKCDLISDFKIGDKITVEFSINGRKWVNPKGEEVYFNSLKAWKIIPTEEGVNKDTGASTSTIPKTKEKVKDPEWLNDDSETLNTDDDNDDLPF